MSHLDRRIHLIAKVRNTLKALAEKDLEVNEEDIIMLLGAEEGVARRTAKDYIACAKMQLKTQGLNHAES